MKHRIKGYKLNRDTTNRKALFKSLVSALIQVGEIKTTETKAKAIKGLADRLIHRAQEGSINTRRLLGRFFGRRDIVNHLVDVVAPAMNDRVSGYTRITKLGKRAGDNATMVKVELVKKPDLSTQKKEQKVNKKEAAPAPVVAAPEKQTVKKKSPPKGKTTKKTA